MLYMELKKMDQMKELRRKEAALRRAISAYTISSKQTAVGYSVGSNAERVRQLRAKLAEAQEQLKLHDGSSDARIARVMEIEAYAKQYQSGMMMEVPTVVSLKEDLAEDMRARRHYLIAGHLGGGKTELARQAVRQFMIEQGIGYDVERLKSAVQRGDEEEKARIVQDIQPLIYSASEDSSVYDLIGIWKLEARPTPSPEQAAAQAQEMADGFKERGIDLPVEEAVKILMGQANLVETVFRHTALGQAVAEGKPIIIDEINMMRNETRGALNNILTARVGQDVSLPGNGGGRYAIKPGFVALGTLNLGAQYGGTKEFNAAQLSRWVGREMDYPEVSETFDLILAALLRGDRATLPPEFPPEEYARLGALAIVTREVQEIFSGKTPGMMFMARATGMEAGTALLQKSVISPRDLLRGIIEPWRDSGFATSLDDIIAANILARAKLAMGDEQKFLAELFIRRGFFQRWSAKRFRDAGVASVSQKEIDALQAALTSDEFKAQDKWSDAMKDMEARAGMIQSAMLVGNRTLNLVE
jgi:MoxR-like ATPase